MSVQKLYYLAFSMEVVSNESLQLDMSHYAQKGHSYACIFER